METRILSIALHHENLIAVQRAKRILRLRYGINLPRKNPMPDPVWLSAYDL